MNVFVSVDSFKKSVESRLLQVNSLELELFNGIGGVTEERLSDELSGL